MNIFLTSDLHLGHDRIRELADRPFDSVEEMNEALIDNWNSVVGKDDLTFVLGDVCMGKRDETVPLVARLNGMKVLVCGNHDHPWSHRKNSQKWMHLYAPYFIKICDHLTSTTSWGDPVDLYHFPFTGDSHDEDRYDDLRLEDKGQWLLHGHTHQKERISGPRSIHVGVDAWDYTPVHQDQIDELMESMR